MSRDPIGYLGGINLYGYCGNNPVNRIDPSGYRDGWPGPGLPRPQPGMPGVMPPPKFAQCMVLNRNNISDICKRAQDCFKNKSGCPPKKPDECKLKKDPTLKQFYEADLQRCKRIKSAVDKWCK